MELLQLLYFCDAAETQNFSETARKHNVPTTGISQSIRRLEKELGVLLFDRTSNGIKLNKRGKDFYVYIKSSLDMINDAKRKACEEEVQGTINLLVETNRVIVNEAIKTFNEKHKKVSFQIDYYRKTNLENYDLIITDNFAYNKLYERQSFIKEKIVLMLNKNHSHAGKEKISLADFANDDFISYTDGTGQRSLTTMLCGREKFAPNIIVKLDDPHGVAKLVEMGVGVAIVPEFAYKDIVSDSVVFKEFTHETRNTYICYHNKKYMAKPTKYFMETLFEIVKK